MDHHTAGLDLMNDASRWEKPVRTPNLPVATRDSLSAIDPTLRLTSADAWASRYSAAFHRLMKDATGDGRGGGRGPHVVTVSVTR